MTADQQANSDATNAAAKTAEPQSFKEAFAKGRANALAGGSKTFTWNGKSYTTELASSKPAAKTVTSKAESSTPKAESSTPKAESSTPKAESSTPKPEYKTEFQRQQEAAGEGADAFRRVLNKVGDKIKSSVTPNKTESKGSGSIDTSSINKKTLLPEKKMAKGGPVRSHSSKRGDGIAQRGHTKGRYM
jgi:hypothetical protein